MAKKIEMLNDQQEVVHPLTSSDCVIMENGKTLEEVMGDGIATPTVTHEGASFQVGVGDSNIEVVDGDVAGMTLEGQTYQNILPKPTTLIMETDEKEFKINDKIDNNIVLDDNIAEIATIKGQTYVNVVQEESATEYTVLGEELSGQSITTTGKPEGVIKNATLEGMTLVNTIQEPSEANSVVLDLDEDINAQSATIDNTVQGGIHGAILKGQSLVNIHNSTTFTMVAQNNNWFDNYVSAKNKVSFTITDATFSGWRYINLGALNLTMLKPNTKYLVVFSEAKNITTVRFLNSNGSKQLSDEALVINGKAIVTTKSNMDLDMQILYIYFNMQLGEVAVKDAMIFEYQEGMENWDIPYFDGMKSVEAPSVKTTGKNLFDGILAQGYIGDATGEANTSKVGVHSPNYMKVKPNTTYIRTITGSYPSGVDGRVYFYDVNKTYLGTYKNGATFATPENAQYMRLRYYTVNGEITPDSFSESNIQIEEGTQATSYEPYQSSTVTAIGELLPILETEQGCYYSASTGTRLTSNPNVNSVKYEVQGLSKVYVKVAHSNFSFWDSNDTYISGQPTITGGDNNEGYLGIPTNAVYMRCAVDNTKIAEVYEPATLRKVGDVQDELDLETGKLTQRIGEYILNGTENITKGTDDDGYINTTQFFINGVPRIERSSSNKTISNLFFNEYINGDYEHFYTVQNRVIIFISKSKLESNDVLGFTKWLQANNIIIQQELTTPIVKTVDLSIVDQSNNSLKTIQVQPTLTHITTSSNGLIPFVTIPSQLKYPTIIKPSTTYTLKLKRDVVDSANQLTVNVGGASTSVTSDVMTITTPSTLTSQDIVFTGKNNVISKLQLIEDDVTGINYPYFEGMLDVKSPKLLATGKNLIKDVLVVIQDRAEFAISPLVPNKTYKYSLNYNISQGWVNLMNDDGSKEFTIQNWGENKTIFVAPDNANEYTKIRLWKANFAYDSSMNMQLEEGEQATSYEPYKGVTIEQDIDSIPLTSSMFEQNAYITFNAIKGMSLQQIPQTTNVTNRIRSKTLIKVKPNTTYQTLSSDITYSGVAYFDKNGAYINVVAVGTNNEFKTSSNTYYVALNVKRPNDSDIIPSDIPSDLVLQEVTDEIVLRSIGDVKDTLNLTTGEYVQRIGEIIIDGSEGWTLSTDFSSTYNSYYFILNEAYKNNMKCISDKYQVLSRSEDLGINIGIYMGNSQNKIAPFITSDKMTLSEFKEYLSKNPTTVQYELATPIIKKVNLTNTTKLPSYASTTHYDTIVSSNSLVPNIKIPSTINYNVAIKPSTQYTVRCNTTNAMSVDLGGSVGTLANGKVTLTTPSTLAHNSLKLGNGKAKEVMVIEGNEIKDNIPFFNGMKNVQMGGIKLVNIARGATIDSNKIIMNANKTQFTYTSTGGSEWCGISFDVKLLKPNTLYTVYMNIVKNTLAGNASSAGGAKICLGDSGNKWLEVEATTGIYCKTMKTTDRTVRSDFGILIRPNTEGQQLIVKDFMVFEGDWTHLDEIPFIESEMIIEQPIIRSQGKNLFDVNKLVQDTNGSHFNSGGYRFPLINFEVGKTYTISVSESKWIKIGEFSSGVTIVENFNTTKLTITITNDLLKSYIMVNNSDCSVITDVEWLRNNVQIEEGSSATAYEPFKQHTLSSNRVIGYEENCYYANGAGAKVPTDTINSVMADVEGLSVAYVTGGSSNYTFWDKDDVFISGKVFLDTALSSYDKNGFITVPSNAKYMRFAAGGETNAQPLYKVATVTGELPLRSLPNGVCDSFNLVTGEYVQRVGEIVLDGSSDENWTRNNDNDAASCFYSWKLKDSGYKLNGEVSCDYFKELEADRFWLKSNVGIFSKNGNKAFYLVVTKDMLSAYGNSISNYLLQNPITVQFELETPIVRKIGLTAKGNYKEIELNGSENWGRHGNYGSVTRFNVTIPNMVAAEHQHVFSDAFPKGAIGTNDLECINSHGSVNQFQLQIKTSRLTSDSVESLKQWLSLNPFKIGYLTTNSASLYSNIQKPIFFNNVDIQFMNNNIDIQPSLTLQARSRNSYVMDMMKPNTLYTSKFLQSANGSTFIDGTVVSMKINNTFTSPSTLTNKLMITPLNRQEFMIIEGDVTRFTIPYYKGIRSAYDSANEIEVYSAGKNLFNINGDINEKYSNVIGNYKNELLDDGGLKANNCTYYHHGRGQILKLKPNTTYTITGTVKNHGAITIHSKTKNNLLYHNYNNTSFVDKYTTKSDETELCFCFVTEGGENKEKAIFYNIQIEESSTATPYQPHEENTTIINMPMQLETVEVVKLDRVKDMEIGAIIHDNGTNMDSPTSLRTKNYIPVQPSMHITYCNNNVERATHFIYYDINKNFIGIRVYVSGVTSEGAVTTPDNCYFIRLYHGVTNVDNLTITKKQYKPTALNKLPNGVKDELIINRATSGAKLIRRVGKVLVDGNESGWTVNVQSCSTANTRFVVSIKGLLPNIKVNNAYVIADEMNVYNYNDSTKYPTLEEKIVKTTNEFYLYTSKADSISLLKQYLNQNPLTVYYELAEPVVTEISLKGYPYVYKDGLVQLNTEIPHTTKVKYNVNQEHLINGQNETIIRHDKQIDNLYDYIELYLEEEYRMELFRMQLELSL